MELVPSWLVVAKHPNAGRASLDVELSHTTEFRDPEIGRGLDAPRAKPRQGTQPNSRIVNW